MKEESQEDSQEDLGEELKQRLLQVAEEQADNELETCSQHESPDRSFERLQLSKEDVEDKTSDAEVRRQLCVGR